MEVLKYPRLCGGTFFTLILECQKQKAGKNSFKEPEIFVGLQCVIAPDFSLPKKPESIKVPISKFKSCTSPNYIFFSECPETTEFCARVKNNYRDTLCNMASFVDHYIATSTSGRRDYRLVAALIDLVLKDESIPSDTVFYINPDGTAVQKSNFNELTEICITSFLLGILHFVLTERLDNKIGEMTYNAWCPPQNGAPRRYKGNMGETVLPRLSKVYPYIKKENSNNVNVVVDSQTVTTPTVRITKYLSYIEKASARYNVMKLIGGDEVPLENFFVCNTIGEKERVFIDKKRIKSLFLDDPDLDSIRNMYKEKLGYDNKRTILIGSGGAGKSLMLQHLFLKAAANYVNTGILPVFLELRYYTQNSGILDFIVDTVSSKDESFNTSGADKQLKEGKIQLLMDGFDEIDPSDIKPFLLKLNTFLDKYSDVQVVITSRQNENLSGLHQFVPLYVWPFDTEQTLSLIDKILSYQGEQGEREAVINYINRGFLKENGIFATNPLLLTYVTMQYPSYNRFNKDHHLFYRETYEALLSGHDDNKKPYDRVFKSVDNASQFSKVFMQFCAFSYRDGVFKFDSITFDDYFDMLTAQNEFSNPKKMNSKNFKHDAFSTACMMYEREHDIYYIDPGFQEFLFAEYYAKATIKETEELVPYLMRLPYGNVLSFDALDMLYNLVPEKFRIHILLPFLKKIFKEDDVSSFVSFLEKCFKGIHVSVHDEVAEVLWKQMTHSELILREDVENYPSTILLDYILKMINYKRSFQLFSESYMRIDDECDETGRFIGKVGDVNGKKTLFITCEPLEVYLTLNKTEKKKETNDWLVNDSKELIVFGYRLTLDPCFFSDNLEKYRPWLQDLLLHSQETYTVFCKIKKMYIMLKKEKRRQEI